MRPTNWEPRVVRGWRRGSEDEHHACPSRVRAARPALEPRALGLALLPEGPSLSALAPTHPSFAVCKGLETTSSAPRVARRSPRPSRATRPSRYSGLLPGHQTHPPMPFSSQAACTRSLHTCPFSICAASRTTNLTPTLAWRSPRPSRATQPSIRSCLLPCHRTHTRPCF